jgi:molybdenum cofactor cytidylyltransferase
MKNINLGGLLIAGGLSQRMGQFKPLMKYDEEEFVVSVARKLIEVCDKVIVVTGFQKDKIEKILNSNLLPQVECVYNPDYAKGMFTSLKTGLNELHNFDWVLYHFVDQPFHSKEFYKDMISQIDGSCDWIQPVYKGKEGHPVLFNKKIIGMVNESPNDSQLRYIRDDSAIRIKRWGCNYSSILIDFDTPDDIRNIDLKKITLL